MFLSVWGRGDVHRMCLWPPNSLPTVLWPPVCFRNSCPRPLHLLFLPFRMHSFLSSGISYQRRFLTTCTRSHPHTLFHCLPVLYYWLTDGTQECMIFFETALIIPFLHKNVSSLRAETLAELSQPIPRSTSTSGNRLAFNKCLWVHKKYEWKSESMNTGSHPLFDLGVIPSWGRDYYDVLFAEEKTELEISGSSQRHQLLHCRAWSSTSGLPCAFYCMAPHQGASQAALVVKNLPMQGM